MTKTYITYTRKIHFKGIGPTNEPITQYEDPNTNNRIKYEWSGLFTILESGYGNQEIELAPGVKILDRRMIAFLEYDENIVTDEVLQKFITNYFPTFNFEIRNELYINGFLLEQYGALDGIQNITVKDFIFTDNRPIDII